MAEHMNQRHMQRRTLVANRMIFLALVPLLVSCTASSSTPHLPPEHPASLDAPLTPLPEPSRALAVTEPVENQQLPAGDHTHVGPGTEDHVLGPAEEADSPRQKDAAPGRGGGKSPATTDPADFSPGATPHESEGVMSEEHGSAGSNAADQPSERERGIYACPMHPEVTSDQPGQRCSKCGMELVEQKGEEHGK